MAQLDAPARSSLRALSVLVAAALLASACASGPHYRTERVYHAPAGAAQRAQLESCRLEQSRCLERAALARQRCQAHSGVGAACAGFEDECRRSYDDCFTDAGGRIEITRMCVRSCQALYRPSERYRPAEPALETAQAR